METRLQRPSKRACRNLAAPRESLPVTVSARIARKRSTSGGHDEEIDFGDFRTGTVCQGRGGPLGSGTPCSAGAVPTPFPRLLCRPEEPRPGVPHGTAPEAPNSKDSSGESPLIALAAGGPMVESRARPRAGVGSRPAERSRGHAARTHPVPRARHPARERIPSALQNNEMLHKLIVLMMFQV